MTCDFDAIVLGGGYYGCRIAVHLMNHLPDVALVERDNSICGRATYANQARIHNGYHYPRSILTALRSRVNYDRFRSEHASCLHDSFQMYYAIARTGSKVTPRQFATFCDRIGAPHAPAPVQVRGLFDPRRIAEVFLVEEAAFDAERLRISLAQEIDRSGVVLACRARARAVRARDDGFMEVEVVRPDGREERLSARYVFNCTYADLNDVLDDSGLSPVPLKFELAELALVEVPGALAGIGITVMDGPFFSVMPFPAQSLHTLTHVRYTPHHAWHWDSEGSGEERGLAMGGVTSNFPMMMRDARRYVPSISDCAYTGSLYEVKTLLPMNEVDDGRPILFSRSRSLPGLFSILGGKIDNIYDILDEIDGLMRRETG